MTNHYSWTSELGADRKSKDAKFSIAGMKLNYESKQADVNEDSMTVWSVDTEYRITDSWDDSGFVHWLMSGNQVLADSELKPMEYKQAINGPDGVKWRAEIDNEHDCIVKNNVF